MLCQASSVDVSCQSLCSDGLTDVIIFTRIFSFAAGGAYSIGDWCPDVCVSSNFLQIATPPPTVFFSDSHVTWHTWSVWQYEKNCGTDFRNFDFKNFYQIFQHFKFGLVCGTGAVELSMMTGLSSYTLQQLRWCQLNATCLFIVHLVHCTSCTLVSRCLHGTAPPYLADQLQPVAALESRRRLRSSASLDWTSRGRDGLP